MPSYNSPSDLAQEEKNKKNKSTFRRSPHDKKNPYVMINKNILFDKTISPKAKGVLCYFFAFPDDWQFYHWKICEDLNIGEKCLNSAIEELQKAGYVKRKRPSSPDGRMTCYDYEVSELKEFLPDAVIQPGSSSLENAALLSNKLENTKILPPLPPPKKEKKEEEEDFKKIEEYIHVARENKMPFKDSGIYAAYEKYGISSVRKVLNAYSVRNSKLPSLFAPDIWLDRECEKEYNYQLTKDKFK